VFLAPENQIRKDSLMIDVVDTRIKAFGKLPKADFVSPSEQLITLTIGQLQDLLKEAIQPLQDRIISLEATVTHQEEKIAALESTAETQADNQLIQLRLISQLREAIKKEAQPMQKDRADILRALIAVNGGKMLAKEARQKMHLIKPRFSELLATMKDDIEIRPYHLKKNQKVLVLK
jgi:uncharacterized coiled-coil protein SlyX